MIGSLLGCDAMSVGTWHDMASHPRILKSAGILEGPTLRWGWQINSNICR